jgi:lysophospholipase L1-like esterase
MDGYMITPYVQKKGGAPISMVIKADLSGTEQSLRLNEYKMYLFSFGGIQNLTNLNFKIYSRKNADLALGGDSRFYGYNSGTGMTSDRICSQLIGNIVAKGNYVNYSVSGGRMTQLATELDVLIKHKPKIFLISLGINDAGASVSRSTFAASVTTIVNALSSYDIKVAITTIVGSTDATTDSLVANYNTDLRARNDIILLDVAPTMMTAGAIKSTMTTDNIHYNELGHYTFFQYIKDNFQYKSPVQYPFLVTKTSSSNVTGAFPSFTLSNVNATLENGTTNHNVSSIYLNSGNNASKGFIASSYNSGGLGSQLSIGTSTSSPLALYSNNNKRLNINPGGDIGINGTMYLGGIAVPNSYLQIAAGNASFPAFSLTTQTAYTGGQVGSVCLENTNDFSFIGNLTMKRGATANIGTSDNFGLQLITNGTNRVSIGTTGIVTLTGALVGAASQDIFNTVTTTANVIGAATSITMGASSGTATIRNTTVTLSGGTVTGAATQNVFNSGSTTIGAFGGATGLYLGGGASGNVSHYYSYAATTSGQTKLIEIGTNGLSGSTTNIAIGSAVSGASGITTINSPLVLKNYTVATLPAGSIGMKATVTDALTPVYDTNVVGGGARVIEVIFNGTTWTCH